MLTKEITVATQAANINIFDKALQLNRSRCTVELKPDGTDAETKAILKVSASGRNFDMPHEDAEVLIPAGSDPVVVAFEGLTVGSFIEIHFDKQAATSGTIKATLI